MSLNKFKKIYIKVPPICVSFATKCGVDQSEMNVETFAFTASKSCKLSK